MPRSVNSYPKTRRPRAYKPDFRERRRADPIGHNGLLRWMEAHLEWMVVTGYSPDTARAGRVALRRFIAWCDERGLSQPADITKQVLERYQRHLFYHRKPDGSPMTIGTQAGCLSPLKLWFKWLARENHILFNPASELEIPRPGQQLPRVILSVPEVESILSEADGNNPMGLRDRAMLELLYSTALRRMEAAKLAVYDIDFHRRLVMVREGKGRKDRVVPIGARALAWVDKYLIEGRPRLMAVDHQTLFVTDYGEPVSPEFVASRMRRYMEYAGIKKPGSTHLLRHACATHMLERGADIRFIQAILGHAQLTTTQIYTHVAIEKLQAVHEATHPAKLSRETETRPLDGTLPQAEAREALAEVLNADTPD